MQVDELIRQWAAWLNDPAVKTGLLFAGGMVLRYWGAFVSKAIPVALLGASSFLSTLRLMFPVLVAPDGVPTAFSFASFAGVDYYVAASPGAATASWLWNTALPLVIAVGSQSASKNTAQWFGLLGHGVGLLWPRSRTDGKRRPPG
jgi:hypothetical protein